MGRFGKRSEAPQSEPVRRGKVMGVLAAYMAETDAGDGPGLGNAAQRLSDACKGASKAEIRAAHAAANRNGYR